MWLLPFPVCCCNPPAAKRQRSSDKSLEEEGVTALKESGGRSRENSTAGTAVPLGSGKPPKKKIKVKKKYVFLLQ